MNLLFDNLEKLIDAPNGIEKAREMILQLAVQGKLVKQGPNDEPASELLKKVKKEKEKLIADGKIKKQKELPPIKEEEKPFDLPKGWAFTRVGIIGYTQTGTTPHKDEKLNFGDYIPFIKPADIYSNYVDYFNEGLSEEGLKKGRFIPKDSILMVCIGTIGKGNFVDRDVSCNQQINSLTPYSEISIEFLNYQMRAPFFQKSIMLKASKTTLPIVNKSKWDSLIITLPPLNEQKRIVEKVNGLMSLLDELEEKRERRNQKRIKLNNASLDKLLTSKDDKELNINWKRIEENFRTLYSVPVNVEKLKQAIRQLAVQGKLVKQDPNDEPASELLKKVKKEKEKLIAEGKIKKQKELPPIKDEEKPFELPKGWEWVRNGDLLNELLGGFSYKSNSFIKKGNNQVIRLGNIRPGRLRLDENAVFISDDLALETVKYSLKENDILITMTGTKGKRDYCYTVRLEKNKFQSRTLFLNQRVGCFRYNHLMDFLFLDIVLKNDLILDNMYASSTGTANQANIGVTILNEVLVPLPPLNEQKRIVEKVNELMSLYNTLEEKLSKKEAIAERLVGAVVNKITNGKQHKDSGKEVIKDLMNTHKKTLEKLR